MKRCYKCGIEKPLPEFNNHSKHEDGKQDYCRVCTAAYFKARRDEIIPMIRARQRRVRRELSQYIRKYLLEHPCVDCGEIDPVVLEFDHVRGEKKFNISTMVVRQVKLSKLDEEIAKCEVRCANCHRRKTARQFGWYAWLEDAA